MLSLLMERDQDHDSDTETCEHIGRIKSLLKKFKK